MPNRMLQFIAVSFTFGFLLGCDSRESASQSASRMPVPAATDPAVSEVEAACGECQFHMPGTGCDLAVRIAGQPYFVTGTRIDEHGDAHAVDGFCNAIRKARVTGRIEGDRYVATGFELLPAK